MSGLRFTLNGRPVLVEDCSPNLTLLEYLRRNTLIGAKEGCAEGDCGACSVVLVDSDSSNRTAYRSVNSCLLPLCLLAGREIITVEGIALGKELHPLQREMVRCHGSQCGYCTPGFIAALFEGYYRGDIRNASQLDAQLCGNLCRCTGYRSIREAAFSAFSQRQRQNGNDGFAARLRKPPPQLETLEYGFGAERFFRPGSLPELLELRARVPEARLIAGATELGLDITKRFKKFPVLLSLEAVPELKLIDSTESEWRIGAAVTLTQIEEKLGDEFPALRDMLRVFGSRQIRNRATMGGNLIAASPIGDSAPVLLALGAHVVLASLRNGAGSPPIEPRTNGSSELNERVVPIEQFFVGYRRTALRPDEVLKTIVIPRFAPPGLRRECAWYKVSKRREMDISTVAACFAVDLDQTGTVQGARLAYGGVAETPARARKTEEALIGRIWNEAAIEAVLLVLETEFTTISDVRGSADFRRVLVSNLLRKFHFEHPFLPLTRSRGLPKSVETIPVSLAGPKPLPHESAHQHVTGTAVYTDDQTAGKPMLEVWPVCATHARAKILKRDSTAARTMPGIEAVLMAEDIPGENDSGVVKKDEPLLARKDVHFHGQPVALVVGHSQEECRAAAEKIVVEYQPLEPVLTLQQALARNSFHNEPNFIRRGNVDVALKAAPMRLAAEFELGGQEHFYLETHAAWAQPGEDGTLFVSSSTQHPSEVQTVVAHVCDVPSHKVVVQSLRMGGAFGGKETQAAVPAALAALAARHTGKAVRIRWNRDQDMMFTGHRHPFLAKYEVGFDTRGCLLAARIHLFSNGGWSQDLSQAVTDRALFHLDNAYYLPCVEFRGQVAKTNLSSNTAFRGFGGPQGMLVIEEIIDRVARRLALPPETVRERNLYRGKGEANTTHYGQKIGDNRIQKIWHGLKNSSHFTKRREEISRWNEAHPYSKRGLAITPVKFGISFTVTSLNQAGALALLYRDGTLQVNHGGTEMGQGVHTNIQAIAARALGLRSDQVRVMPTSTDKVPNTSATAASCGTDLNGEAVRRACAELKARLLPIAAKLLKEANGRVPNRKDIVFAEGTVFDSKCSRRALPISQLTTQACLDRVSLSATGYYTTPGIHWDRAAGCGRPFHYFACGAAVAEVELDGFTGMMRLLRADILHDVGDPLNEGVGRGQVEGGFVQGVGWLTTEELIWDENGRLLTHSPDTYKIPSIGDVPVEFNVAFLKGAAQKGVVYGSKAVGEPPLMLAISVREALRDAVAAFGPPGGMVELASPATCEAILNAITKRSRPSAVKRVGRAPDAV